MGQRQRNKRWTKRGRRNEDSDGWDGIARLKKGQVVSSEFLKRWLWKMFSRTKSHIIGLIKISMSSPPLLVCGVA